MKTLSAHQYEYLCAIARRDYDSTARIVKHIATGELLSRGLYICQDHPLDPGMLIRGSQRLTPAGHDAIMCYKALTGSISL